MRLVQSLRRAFGCSQSTPTITERPAPFWTKSYGRRSIVSSRDNDARTAVRGSTRAPRDLAS